MKKRIENLSISIRPHFFKFEEILMRGGGHDYRLTLLGLCFSWTYAWMGYD